MKANNTPLAARLVAIVSLTTALCGAVLAGGVSLPVAAGAARTASDSATALHVAPAMRCGSDCPWDGTNS